MWPWSSTEKKLRKAAEEGDVARVRKLLEKRNVDVDVRDESGWTPLHYVSANGYAQVVELLLKANASVDATSEGLTPLHNASFNGHDAVVELLLKANASVDTANANGWTPLHYVSENGYAQVVELLLKANASIDVADKGGWTPLHIASEIGQAAVVELLLNANAFVDVSNQVRRVLMLTTEDVSFARACGHHHPDVARLLLKSGANLGAKDEDGFTPLHILIEAHQYASVDSETLHTLQVLVTHGAVWDGKCDEIVSAGHARDEAPALALCMQAWTQELADGLPFSNIPIEIVKRGVESTQQYIDSLKNSLEVVLRRKICLVGPSCAGKTSFVKSITTKKPQLVHLDDRTIGIDHFPLRFEQYIASRDDTKIHEVTFWDFAGQDAYQVAHSLFFSRRTLFLVFVDLEAFTIAYKQAVLFGRGEEEEAMLLDEFIERSVLRWIRLIVARQPVAEFAFIATKEDLVRENEFMKSKLKKKLETRLRDVEATARDMKAAAENQNVANFPGVGAKVLVLTKTNTTSTASSGHRSSDWRERVPSSRTRRSELTVMFVSCASDESVHSARVEVQALITKSNYSVEMPDDYSKVLNAVVKIREEATALHAGARIKRVFAPVESLLSELQIDPGLCRLILQTLHDLGDVLWYERLQVDHFHDIIILDPMLLIDFIREVINHNHDGVKLTHQDLEARKFWKDLNDPSLSDLMKALKQLMQRFHLVYSAADDRIMEWDSHLIVPAFWQTKPPAAWRFLDGKLRINSPTSDGADGKVRVRVRWEYFFKFGLPANLFDHFVVASVSPWFRFDAGPDWLLHEGKSGLTACRIMIDRDHRSLHRTIHVEALIAEGTSLEDVSDLWENFQLLGRALVTVLGENAGLTVSCNAMDRDQREHNLKDLLRSRQSRELPSWMPPVKMWRPSS